jgi:predicted metal-dependent hydrolase
MFKRLFRSQHRPVTLESVKYLMEKEQFDPKVMNELLMMIEKRIKRDGDEQFQKWFSNLHFSVPDEYMDEAVAKAFYQKHSEWIEDEIKKLEEEVLLSWEEQSEDLIELDDEARKAQLVIRHRLTDIYLDL